MPTADKPLPAIHVQGTSLDETPWLLRPPQDDIVVQIREATFSPSPLLRILQDPSILPPDTPEYQKSHLGRNNRQPSRSPRRGHGRSEAVAALAIAEEEKQSRQLKSLLRVSGERLEYEIRRADDAIVRAEVAERQEKTYLARAKAAETKNEDLQKTCSDLERDVREYQMQMEAARREVRILQAELEDRRREIEEVRDQELQTQETLKTYQRSLHGLQLQMREQDLQMQNALDEWYDTGRDEGYEEGYDDGHKAGRKIGVKEGLKKGMREGLEQGRREERRNAIEAFDRFLLKEMRDEEQKIEWIRRWAQSIYNDGNSETVYPVDSASLH